MTDESDKRLIGMVHLPALPGAPCALHSVAEIERLALADARRLMDAGMDGVILENFADAPFYPGRVPRETLACMARLASTLRRALDAPVGVNVLRNDGRSALAVALAADAQFIRVNILCGARVTDQGIVQGIAHQLLRDRMRLSAQQIEIWADVDVKHSLPLAKQPLAQEVADLIERGGADALIVSGTRTGAAVDQATLTAVQQAAQGRPVIVGSGVSADNIQALYKLADALIIGTAVKEPSNAAEPQQASGGSGYRPVSLERARALVELVRR